MLVALTQSIRIRIRIRIRICIRIRIRIRIRFPREGTKGTVLEIDEKEWDSVFAINVRGPWLVTKTVSRRMISSERRNCSIINIASISGIERGLLAGAPAYSASKAAVIRLTSVQSSPRLLAPIDTLVDV